MTGLLDAFADTFKLLTKHDGYSSTAEGEGSTKRQPTCNVKRATFNVETVHPILDLHTLHVKRYTFNESLEILREESASAVEEPVQQAG